MGTIEVLKPGMLSSVQDGGRVDYQDAGVPRSGAFDLVALSVGNRLLGNADIDAAIEMTMTGGEFRFMMETVVCITGARADDAMILCGDHRYPLCHQQPTVVPLGSTLRIGRLTNGARAYLCVAGGIQTPMMLGSRSALVSLPDAGLGRALIPGDSLIAAECITVSNDPANKLHIQKPKSTGRQNHSLRIVPGAHYDMFTGSQHGALVENTFSVSDQSNRAGLRLSSSNIPGSLPCGIASEGTLPGYIQVPQSGSPIVLGVDGPTTGGYPVIASVIEADLPVLAQCEIREQVQFRWVSRQEAMKAIHDQHAMIQSIQPQAPHQLSGVSPNA
ncbi:MAG: biotin-dependent carboxyltransferase family protein [Phycisphaerales bacterium]